jgi:hypothetical protein
MEIIERYIYAVTKRLPEASRSEVDKELRANIRDMLPEEYTEAQVKDVLNQLGDPAKLADEYRGTKRYLIGPGVYDSYLATLKLILSIVVPITVVAILISSLVEINQNSGTIQNVIEMIGGMISGAISAALQVALWVTLGFAIAERTEGVTDQLPFSTSGHSWSVDKLEPIPAAGVQKITRAESIFDMIWVIVVTSVFLYAPHIIGIYTKSDSGNLVLQESLFAPHVLRAYTPLIIAVALIGLFKAILKIIHQYWNLLLASVNALGNALFVLLIVSMFTNERLINPGFKVMVSNAIELDFARFEQGWSTLINTAMIVIAVICVVDTLGGFWKAWRKRANKLAS